MELLILTTLAILAVYLCVCLLSFIFCVLGAQKLKSYQIEQKYFNHPYFNQLFVVIYAHNDEKKVVSLLEKLNKQTYSKSNYQVHIILDNCEDNSSNMLEFVGGAKIWRVGENETLGKDAALSWVLERLISFQNVNAYVFLDVNKSIDENLLSNINSALFSGDVLVGATELISESNALLTNIKKTFNKFYNRIILTGRRFLFGGLATTINSDITIMKQEVLEKVKCIDFKDVNTELKYTTLLVKNRIIPKFAPNVVVYDDAQSYEFKKPSLQRRLSLFAHCLSLLFTTNLKFIEHMLYQLRPNFCVMAAIFTIVAWFTFTFDNWALLFRYILIFTFVPLSVLFWLTAVKMTELKKNEILQLVLYPAYKILKPFMRLATIKNLISKLQSGKNCVQILEKFSVDVIVEGGQKSFKCKLEIIKEENFTKAVFLFRNKKYTSVPHLRTFEAINEIIEKLDAHGFRLKICQTCGYFCPKLDTDTNELKGVCHCERKFESLDSSNEDESYTKNSFLWNLCEKYIPKEINNVIDISTYRQ